MLRQKLPQRMAADLLKTQTSLWGHQKKMYWETFHDCFTTSLEITCRLLQSLFSLSPHPGLHSALTDVTSDSKEPSASLSAVKDEKKIGLMPPLSSNQSAATSQWAAVIWVLSATTAYVNTGWATVQLKWQASFVYRFDNVQTIADFCAVSPLNRNNVTTFSTVFLSWTFQEEQRKCAAYTMGGKRRCPLSAK